MNEVEEIRPGHYKNIDEYVRELKEAGYKADYENVWSGTAGFTAIVTVEGREHAVFEGDVTGHMVKDVKTPLTKIRGCSTVCGGEDVT